VWCVGASSRKIDRRGVGGESLPALPSIPALHLMPRPRLNNPQPNYTQPPPPPSPGLSIDLLMDRGARGMADLPDYLAFGGKQGGPEVPPPPAGEGEGSLGGPNPPAPEALLQGGGTTDLKKSPGIGMGVGMGPASRGGARGWPGGAPQPGEPDEAGERHRLLGHPGVGCGTREQASFQDPGGTQGTKKKIGVQKNL